MESPALVISILALLFTVFSFWWMNWREGRLIVGPPRAFAATAQPGDGLLIVQLPLVFYNSGALALVVENLRLTLEHTEGHSPILYFNNTLANLSSNEDRQWARQFAVEARSSFSTIFVFQRRPGNFHFIAGTCRAKLEGKLSRSTKWRTLLTFDLQTPPEALETLNGRQLIPHDNDPDRYGD